MFASRSNCREFVSDEGRFYDWREVYECFMKCAIGVNDDHDVGPVAFTLVLLLPVSKTLKITLIRVSEGAK
jgi:hypothetical protein